MNNCEEYQVNISAMLDGELQGRELAETVNHLAECDECMAVFRSFQALQTRIDTEIEPPEVPEGIWDGIESEAVYKPKTVKLRSHIYTIIGIAAALFFFAALGYYIQQPAIPVIDKNAPIVLAGHKGRMTEERFLELTRELLTADSKYHRKMYYILSTLQTDDIEGGFDPPTIEQKEFSPRMRTANGGDNGEIMRY